MTSPFVVFQSKAASKINSTEMIVLKESNRVIVDGILVTNCSLGTRTIQVSAVVEKLQASPVRVFIGKGMTLKPSETNDLLDGRCFYLSPQDQLILFTDSSQSECDVLVSYRELTELLP